MTSGEPLTLVWWLICVIAGNGTRPLWEAGLIGCDFRGLRIGLEAPSHPSTAQANPRLQKIL